VKIFHKTRTTLISGILAAFLLVLGLGAQMVSAVVYTITGTLRDPSNNSVTGAYVYATAPSSSTISYGPVTTAANGSYSLPVSASGTYDIHFVPITNKGWNEIVDSNISITTNQTINHNFSSQTHTLSGTVTDGTGTALTGITVKLGTTQTTTNGSGQYSLTVSAGSYALYLSGAMSGISSFTMQQSTTGINLINSDMTLNPSIKTATMTITPRNDNGQIKNSGNISARATSGTAIVYPGDPGSAISLIQSNGFTANGSSGTITTIVGATYAASGLDSASNQTSVCEPNYGVHYDCLLLPMTVMANVNFDVPNPAPITRTFSGNLSDGSGNPLSGKTIALTGDGTATGVTDASGNFSITGKAKKYAIKVYVSGSTSTLTQNPSTTTVDLTSDNFSRNLVINWAPLTISVVDNLSNPLNNRLVMLSALGGTATLYTGDPGFAISMDPQNFQPGSGSNTGTLSTIVGSMFTARGLNQPNYYGSICARNASNTYDCLASAYTFTGAASINVVSQ
jgi:hypothetical protein